MLGKMCILQFEGVEISISFLGQFAICIIYIFLKGFFWFTFQEKGR